MIITPARILQFVQDLSGWLRDQGSFGAFLLFMATGKPCLLQPNAPIRKSLTTDLLRLSVLSSHPPLFGFASSLTLIGFTFGMWPGALIGIMGSMCGAGLAFWSIRVSRYPTQVEQDYRPTRVARIDLLLAMDETVRSW